MTRSARWEGMSEFATLIADAVDARHSVRTRTELTVTGCNASSRVDEALATTDATLAVIDLDADGDTDVMRRGRTIVVSSELVPEWDVSTPWISVVADRDAPVMRILALVRPLSFVPRLASGSNIATDIIRAESISEPAQRVGEEIIDGREVSRYSIRDPEIVDLETTVWIEDDGMPVQIRVSSRPGDGTQELVMRVVGTDEEVDVPMPPRRQITQFEDLPADQVLLSAASEPEAACITDFDFDAQAERERCIRTWVTDRSVGEYLAESSHPLEMGGCQW
jgi:hypothetical protein